MLFLGEAQLGTAEQPNGVLIMPGIELLHAAAHQRVAGGRIAPAALKQRQEAVEQTLIGVAGRHQFRHRLERADHPLQRQAEQHFGFGN
ncbi:unannotated protein [freshwater metagenome]|uniref:Unannotated protein n=1 Tax=freshwater metagenome TaxID=449393 RepID=A0A6J7KWJ2_9ZZZZ